MTLNELINELLEKKYIIKLGEDNYIVSNHIDRDSPKPETKEVIELPGPTDLLKQFIKDCKIPYRAKTSSGAFYLLAAESEYARRSLYHLVNSGTYKYEDMVKAVGAYYNDTSMSRVTLTNFFKSGLIAQCMEEYKNKPIGPVNRHNRISL